MLTRRAPLLSIARTAALLTCCATVLLSGCQVVDHKAEVLPSPLPHLADIVMALHVRGGSLAELLVTKDFADATMVRDDGQVESLQVWPEMTDATLRTTSYREATAPWALFDPATVAAQVTQMSTSCPDSFNARVSAVSSHAIVATVYCGRSVHDSSDALLNGKKLPAVSTMSVLDWQTLLDEWRTVAGPVLVERVSIFDGKVYLDLAPEDGVGCSTRFNRSFDGWSSVSAYCSTGWGTRYFSLDGLTGAALADAAARAMAEDHLVASSQTSYSLALGTGTTVEMTIMQGGVSPKAEVRR